MNTFLSAVLIVLAAAGIWAVVEAALLLRSSRKAVGEASRSLGEAGEKLGALAGQAAPVIEHADQLIAEAGPAVQDFRPLLGRATAAVDALNSDLERVSDILGDASRITGAASSATTAVGSATSTLAGRFRGLFSKSERDADARVLEASLTPGAPADEGADPGQPQQDGVSVDAPLTVSLDSGYFTYPEGDDGAAKEGPKDAVGAAGTKTE